MKSADELTLLKHYQKIRDRSLKICEPLEIEDYVLQPVVDVSPPKWHLGHTTWFFETFILIPHFFNYQVFNHEYDYIFNSYYESIGARVIRTDRGNLSRPTVVEVKAYRAYVDEAIASYLSEYPLEVKLKEIFILGLNHEEQHQELLLTDIKYILGHNPLFPIYKENAFEQPFHNSAKDVSIKAGFFEIGYEGEDFHFDNERSRHKIYLSDYCISGNLVTNAEYLEFIEDGGYSNFGFWHAEGWDWVNREKISAPLYWHKVNNQWQNYTLGGLKPINTSDPVCHVSYYEAAAFAAWKGTRLPTEAEWEVASDDFPWGQRWEWTESAYLPYPGFKKAPGPVGEYNGKFMVNQMVLRGASLASAPNHSRKTYRNFIHAHLRWQFSGIRIIK